MKLKKLLEEVTGTTIQKAELVKKFIGSEIEIYSDISNISENRIDVSWFDFNSWTADYESKIFDDYFSIVIHYDSGRFGSQLLSFSRGDRVKIFAKLMHADFSELYRIFEFELISIAKINTRAQIKQLEEEAQKRAREQYEAERKKKDGCFIATSCYGNYDSKEVLILREFRDKKLLKTFFGKVSVKFYYSVSPFFARLISKSDLLKKSVRRYFLEPIVTGLERQNKLK